MKTLTELLPGAELLERDETETQYQVTFGRGSFWLDLPSGTDPAEAKLIFVFSGAGGIGRSNNLSHPRLRTYQRHSGRRRRIRETIHGGVNK